MSAQFSDCGRYRYRLDREIDLFGGPTVAFCLHNPSTADGESDDRTSSRGVAFAKSWGASRLIFVNTWAGIATRPQELWKMEDPVGLENDFYIREAAADVVRSGGFMIAAWGSISPPPALRTKALARLSDVIQLLRQEGCVVKALALNKDGAPKHPLYVKGNAFPQLWSGYFVDRLSTGVKA